MQKIIVNIQCTRRMLFQGMDDTHTSDEREEENDEEQDDDEAVMEE